MTAAVLCTEETAACLIPHLISELETPCPCRRHDGLYLTGTSIDGRQVSITVKKGVLEVEGISQNEARRPRRKEVSATNGKPGELTAISKAKDLVNHTMWASNKVFPKSVRFTLSQRMETAALDVLECLIEANEIFPRSAAETAERLDLQKRALTKCKLLLNLLDIALERGYIDIRRCEDWTKKILDVKNLTASWRKKDAARFSPKG